jgi:hypothetical protein
MEDNKFNLTDRDMLIEVLEFYVYRLRKDGCNQAAIDAHVALLQRLEAGSSQLDEVAPGP